MRGDNRDIAKMVLTNLISGEDATVLFNPETIGESVNVNYARRKFIGGGFEHLHFMGRSNRQVSGLRFPVDTHFLSDDVAAQDILDFMRSLTEIDPGTGSPPVVGVTWGSVLDVQVVVTTFGVSHRMFTEDGDLLAFEVTLDVEEFSDTDASADQYRRGLI
ncbi:MAG: hypothetical protein KKH12_16075 [Gammaproteobacteria bacterium]|nr:hypothetical protein [Gammaproteobacteria bacterium]